LRGFGVLGFWGFGVLDIFGLLCFGVVVVWFGEVVPIPTSDDDLGDLTVSEDITEAVWLLGEMFFATSLWSPKIPESIDPTTKSAFARKLFIKSIILLMLYNNITVVENIYENRPHSPK
jgi:hypothetical protein